MGQKMGFILMAGIGRAWDTRNKVSWYYQLVWQCFEYAHVIHGYSHDFTNFKSPAATGFDDNANPITTVGISLEIVPHYPSKRSTTIVLVLSLEPLV